MSASKTLKVLRRLLGTTIILLGEASFLSVCSNASPEGCLRCRISGYARAGAAEMLAHVIELKHFYSDVYCTELSSCTCGLEIGFVGKFDWRSDAKLAHRRRAGKPFPDPSRPLR
jgi:hypothetical protein